MSDTIDMFTKPFAMPEGRTVPPLVERVQIIPFDPGSDINLAPTPDGSGYQVMAKRDAEDSAYWCVAESVEKALLIRAAHEWVVDWRSKTVSNAMNKHVSSRLKGWALASDTADLVAAAHLIADALEKKP